MKTAARVGLGLALLLGTLALLLGGASVWWKVADAPPESATGLRDVPQAQAREAMVAAAHPAAVEAGLAVLRAGGTAMDAAVAVQMALNVVEPQSSGIGGGAFLLYWDATRRTLRAYDGREQAPAAVTPELFLHEDGTPFDFVEAVVGGRSVGVPGVLRMLELAHREHGRMPWALLFEGPARLAEEGFDVGPRLHLLARWDPLLRTMPGARELFYGDDGRAVAVGERLRNPRLAETLRLIGARGADVFYEGELAEAIVDAVARAQRPSTLVAALNLALVQGLGAPRATGLIADTPNPGLLRAEDLRSYQAKERAPVCAPYRAYRVCGMPPPTSGGIAVLQILGILSQFDLGALDPRSVEAAHLLAEAERLAFADRDAYVADPDFVDVPTEALLAPDYLRRRAQLIRPGASMGKAAPGDPGGGELGRFWPAPSPERTSTSHFSIFDGAGNVVSMTTSIENVFGSRVMAGGFLLNNQLTDFSFVPTNAAGPVANAVAPGKRPRSSMAPLLVLDGRTGEPVLSLGSPGGSRIIGYVAQAVVGVLDWGLLPQDAVRLPHVVNRNGATEVEDLDALGPAQPTGPAGPSWTQEVRRGLEALGHEVVVGEQNSGLHAVQRKDGVLWGGADPRREGVAAGW